MMFALRPSISLAAGLVVACMLAALPGCGCTETEPTRKSTAASDQQIEPTEPTPVAEKSQPAARMETAASPNSSSDSAEAAPGKSEANKLEATATKTNQSSHDGGVGGPSTDPPGVDVPQGNPGDARRKANGLSTAAKKSAGQGHYAQAFREAREAWEAVSPHSGDAACRALTQVLERQMRESATKANKNVKPDSAKTLVVE